ncbi:lipoprotein, partial [Photobacterium sanctipauli]
MKKILYPTLAMIALSGCGGGSGDGSGSASKKASEDHVRTVLNKLTDETF